MVIAYLRVSTGKQHLVNQQNEIFRYAKQKELRVDRWITETVSGKIDRNKRRLGRIIQNLHAGDTLIVTELSRLSRSLHEIMLIMKYCIDNGVFVYSTKDGYCFDDSINSKVLSFAFGLSAEIEHKLISQRTKEALATLKAQGKPVGRQKGTDRKMQGLIRQKSDLLSAINDGATLVELYDKLNVSQDTFRRFRSLNPDVEEAIRERRHRVR